MVRGGRASRFEGGCSVSRNRGQALHSPSRPALAKPDPPPPPPSLGRRRRRKKRRSLAHRNVGRAGSRGPHHTTPHRGASSAIAAFYPPGTPSLCRCCTHPYRALASTSLVSSLGFSALVFSGFSAAGPPRDCQTRKKKKKKIVLNHDHHTTQAAAKNLKNRKTRNSQTEISGSFFRGRGRERERDRRRCAPLGEGDDSQDGNSGW